MKNKKNNSLWKVDEQGNLRFELREKMAKRTDRPYTLWEFSIVALFVMIACAVADYIMFRQLFATVLYDSPEVRTISIVGMLIGFDLAPIYLGMAYKKKQVGYPIGNVSVFFFIAMGLALLINIYLRIVWRNTILPDLSQTGTSILGGEIATTAIQGSEHALSFALFAAAVPIVTSLVSFGISYYTFNPLRKQYKQLKLEETQISDALQDIKGVLSELEEGDDYLKRLQSDDEEEYSFVSNQIQTQMVYYCDYVRERIKEHLADPTSTNILSKDQCDELLELYDHMNTCKQNTKQITERIQAAEKAA